VISWVTHLALALFRSRPGILVAPTPWSGTGAAVASVLRRRRAPLIVRVQGRSSSKALLVHGSQLRYRAIEALERFVLRRADLVVPMGIFTAQRALEVGVPEHKIVVVPFPPSWRDRELEPLAAGEKDVKLVICGARLVREKGIDVLIDAFARASATCPDARLCIAGDGPERAELERLAAEAGIADRVDFTGWVEPDEMWRLFKSAGIAVLPSRWEEGLGMVLVEAGLAGCALVASDLGGVRDVVEQGKTGLLVPTDDAEALAGALTRLLNDGDERDRFASAAHEVAAGYVDSRDAALAEFSRRVNDMRSHWS
jgi:glycosyltransferase involved in cell wall biosynthesis